MLLKKKYADYIDSHDNIILQSVRAEQERLQNDMSLAYQVYSQVANQLQVARAKSTGRETCICCCGTSSNTIGPVGNK